MKSKDYASLAGSLATLAIAALGGPLPAVATAGLKEVVTYARARYEKDAPTRDLQREVERVILGWVEESHELQDPESGRLGLTEAAWVVARYGVSDQRSADLGWKPEPAAAEVIATAKANHPYWGSEEHFGLAEEAIRVTYQVLYQQVAASEKVLVPAIRSVRSDIDRVGAQVTLQLQAQGDHLDDRLDTVEEWLRALDLLVSELVRPPLEGVYAATLESMLRPLEDRLPGGLTGREAELAEISGFATGELGYRWLVGGAFTGKTALMLHAVTGALPDTVDVVSYFLRQVSSDADSSGFLTAVVPQLAELCGVSAPSTDVHTFRKLWGLAAEQAHSTGRHLLLVVDGLDEDRHPVGLPSVAAMLPDLVAGSAPGAEHAHVHVTSRPLPDLPKDLTQNTAHPLNQIAHHETRIELVGFPGWEELRDLGLAEIDALANSGKLPRDLLGLMAAAAGPLSAHDLAALHTAPAGPDREDLNDVRDFLVDARSIDRVGPADRPRYQFAHATLLGHAQKHTKLVGYQHPDRLDPGFLARIHAWADRWQQAGWPDPDTGAAGTPRYLLDTYPATLATDPDRRAALVGDLGWVDTAIRTVGVDRVLSTLRDAAAAAGGGRVAELSAVVGAQQANLRPPHPVDQPGHALRHVCLQAMEFGMHLLADSARQCLRALADPGPVPMWTTVVERPPTLELGSHDGWVHAVAVLEDGRVVTGGADGNVRLWDPDHPGQPFALGSHSGSVQAVAVLENGRVVTGGADGNVRLWDPDHPGQPFALGSHSGSVQAVAVLENGRVVTGGADGNVRLWDPDHPGQPLELGSHSGSVQAVAVLENGLVVTGGADGNVRLWDPDHPGQPFALGSSRGATRAVGILDARQVVSGGDDGHLLLWDTQEPEKPTDQGHHEGGVRSVVILDEWRVVTGGWDGRVLLWDLKQPGQPAELGSHTWVKDMGLIDLRGLRLRPSAGVQAVAAIGRERVVSAGRDGRVLLWDPQQSGQPTDLSQQAGWMRAVAFLNDGRIVTGGWDGRVRLWDPAHRALPTDLGHHESGVWTIAVLNDGRVVTGGNDGRVLLWNPEKPRPPIELGIPRGGVRAVGVIDPVRVVTAGWDGHLFLWNLLHPGQPTDLGHHDGGVRAVAVLSDGRVVTGSGDGQVLLWNPNRPAQPTDLGHHDGGVQAVAVLSDGRVVTGSGDGQVLLWNPNRPAQPTDLGHHDGGVQAVAVLSDGRVVTGSGDGQVLLWNPKRPGHSASEIGIMAASVATRHTYAGPPQMAIAHDRGLSIWVVPPPPP